MYSITDLERFLSTLNNVCGETKKKKTEEKSSKITCNLDPHGNIPHLRGILEELMYRKHYLIEATRSDRVSGHSLDEVSLVLVYTHRDDQPFF